MIIGLSGKKGSGKDTCADYLVEKYHFIKISFADTLKDVCQLIFQLSPDQLYGDKKELVDERWGVSPRLIMQFVGTGLFRNQMSQLIPGIGKEFWIKVLQEKIKKLLIGNPYANIIIPDCRFINEITFVKNMGGTVFRVNRESNSNDSHESENETDNYSDYNGILNNNKSKEELYAELIKLINI